MGSRQTTLLLPLHQITILLLTFPKLLLLLRPDAAAAAATAQPISCRCYLLDTPVWAQQSSIHHHLCHTLHPGAACCAGCFSR
jgi:hypothetical protein